MSNYLHALRGRNIPAYAGKTSVRVAGARRIEKHPRIRGENRHRKMSLKLSKETSPHTRGKPDVSKLDWDEFRNIPAYAGKTAERNIQRATSKKHPRIRGENLRIIVENGEPWETSPHTRGKRTPRIHTSPRFGNIPAYAGKTRSELHDQRRARKHPRIRGENLVDDSWRIMGGETSPHTRGKPADEYLSLDSQRNIPAYAGKTTVLSFRPLGRRKHPRIRGEN